MAGLPELDEVFQAAEQPDEAVHDQGMQGCGQPAMVAVRLGGDAQAGDPFGQPGLMN
ncbi:MAG: hypothetical protein IT555_11655 [Acetobacteraceae bacterium]|nr:hypothetical protein [Acetobacteraceae bacterium]